MELLDRTTELEEMKLIFDLFPQKELQQSIRFLFPKHKKKSNRLCFICIPRLPKRCLRELNILMKSENLLDLIKQEC